MIPQKYNWVEIDADGYVQNLYLDAENAPETGIFIKVEDDPFQYIGKQYVDGEFVDVVVEYVEPAATDSEIAQAEMMLMQAEILEKLNAMEV